MDKNNKMNKHYTFFCNRKCEYFPCHEGADPDNFNCLFCYCPLYALGKDCGGTYKITNKGRKDCSECMIPHRKENYKYVTGKYKELAELVKERL